MSFLYPKRNPQFVPWCLESTVTHRAADGRSFEADLAVGVRTGPFEVRERYSSRVTLVPDRLVLVRLSLWLSTRARTNSVLMVLILAVHCSLENRFEHVVWLLFYCFLGSFLSCVFHLQTIVFHTITFFQLRWTLRTVPCFTI